MPGRHFALEHREVLAQRTCRGEHPDPRRAGAAALGCHRSTVYREWARNGCGGDYFPARAQTAADARRQVSKAPWKMNHPPLVAYRSLSGRLTLQQGVLAYQGELIAAKNDDDVFRALFKLFVRKSGPLYGVALVCDNEARLRIIGRFGVPKPDGIRFCQAISRPAIDSLLANPACALIDAEQKADSFDKSIRKYLIGLTILAIPLIPTPGEMIGLAALYRKGEQPFTDDDLAVAEMIVTPTAVAVRRND